MQKQTASLALVLAFLALLLSLSLTPGNGLAAETIGAPYLMAFHACDTASGVDCSNPQNHMVYLAQSEDGITWELVPGWKPFPGSVPDVIRRGDTLYIYTPGQLVRFDLKDNTQSNPERVEIVDLPSGFVDPSLILDEEGRLVMFFLYGQPGGDPAGCAPNEESCVKEIASATEVAGSDGSQFTLDEGPRLSVTIDPASQIKSLSDPDIFFDGNQYVLYVSHGPSTAVWVSKGLRDAYVQETSLPDGMLTFGSGGVPAGYFDPISGQYWTYTHIDRNGLTVIRRAVHADLYHQLNDGDFTIVLSGESVGLGASFSVASPGFAVNLPTAEGAAGQSTPGASSETSLQEQWVSDGIILTPSDLGVPAGMPVADPSAVALPDGRVRLYVFAQEQGVRSLISEDGIDFTVEDGLRVNGGMPRAVPLEDGSVRLFYITSGGIGSATSSDGLNFTVEPGIRFSYDELGMEITPPAVVPLPEGGYRAYFSDLPRPGSGPTPHQVYSAISEDMLTWTLEEGVRIGEGSSIPDSAEHPAALLNPDGSVTLFYCNNNIPPEEGGPTGIYTASSTDGLNFSPSGPANLNGCDPAVIQMPDGTLRMYYGNFDPDTGGVILTAQRVRAPATPSGNAGPGVMPPPGGMATPEFNPFENITPEQEECLRQAWGEKAFGEITSFERPPTAEEETAMQECLGNQFGPPGGEGAPTGGTNPLNDQVYYTTSEDGLTWSEGILLAEKASVPDVMRASDGTLWAYWVDFSYMSGPNMERIGIARSDDNGKNWELLGNVNFTGLGDIVPVDPDVIELPDGRFRLYFYDIAVRQLAHPIYSAISEDGINFTLEEGSRVVMNDVYDPDVIQLPDGSFRMYLNAKDVVSAYSPDGLTFTPEDGVRVENGGVPGSIVLPDGTIRMYACVEGISVYESSDGLAFTLLKKGMIRPSTPREIVCGPSVTALPGDTGYLMVYKVNAGE